MFYALATRKIDTGDINYVHLLSDIETLNRKALKGEYEVSAISFHAYAYMADKYALMSCGASMGRNYGPIVISGKPMQPQIADGEDGRDSRRTDDGMAGTCSCLSRR